MCIIELSRFEELVCRSDSIEVVTTGGIARLVGVDVEREAFVRESDFRGSR